MAQATPRFWGETYFFREGESENVVMDGDSFDEMVSKTDGDVIGYEALIVRHGRTPIPIYCESENSDIPYKTIEMPPMIATQLNFDLPSVENVAIPIQQSKAREKLNSGI